MQEIVALTQDLIRFRSTHAEPQYIRECAAYVASYLDANGIAYRRIDHQGIPSILALPNERFVPVLLMSHIDVVDGPEALFEPHIRDGKLYGRGSIDDKYAVALSLVLMKRYLEWLRGQGKDQSDLPFGILITGDEEIGGHNGAEKALEQIEPEFCIALDGGRVDKVVVKEKGLLTLGLISRGRAAHGARPWLGENAIENLFEDYRRIKGFFREAAGDHWDRTLNLSIIRAGRSFNQVPDRAEATLDIRYTEKDDIDRLVEKMRKAVSGELTVLAREPMFTSGQCPYLSLLLELSDTIRSGVEHGASDARFVSDYGICGVVWGADGDDSAHTAHEHVTIDSLTRLYDLLEEFLKKVEKVHYC